MNLRDSLQGLREFWTEFSRVKSGLVGLAILAVFFFLGIFGQWLIPFPDAMSHWQDITYWEDNPQSAPPAWTNWFSAKKGVPSSIMGNPKVAETKGDGDVVIKAFTFDFHFRYDLAPKDLIVKMGGDGPIPAKIEIYRPDGTGGEIWRDQLNLSAGSPERVSLSRSASSGVIEFVRSQNEAIASAIDPTLVKPMTIMFTKIAPDMETNPVAMKGDYKIVVTELIPNSDSKIDAPTIEVSGHVSGALGTDKSKRDLFTGIILGIRWALIIGIMTSVISVVVGVFLGIVAAYFGGAVDWILTRIYELIYLLPVLPFLIVVSAIFKPSIWTLIILICLFFWTGSYKTVYSMALQIKEETFVEASKALGSGSWRIIVKHISPILLPYSFASMALSIPSIIVYEASVSLLGLGDSTIVSWGQILEAALTQGAVINNLWWWVIPPGLAIALMGMSFAFLGTALDKILHPKLKTR
ncbi:MAG TPA: ABC transporter permease [Rectinemataceae bacterium]|nr:ABC transporter permease [Rectinemataceae bacterium]